MSCSLSHGTRKHRPSWPDIDARSNGISSTSRSSLRVRISGTEPIRKGLTVVRKSSPRSRRRHSKIALVLAGAVSITSTEG